MAREIPLAINTYIASTKYPTIPTANKATHKPIPTQTIRIIASDLDSCLLAVIISIAARETTPTAAIKETSSVIFWIAGITVCPI